MYAENTVQRFNDFCDEATQASKEFVEEHAVPSTMAAFGLGLVAGVAVVYFATCSQQEPTYTKYAQRLGQQFMDTFAKMVPESVSKMAS